MYHFLHSIVQKQNIPILHQKSKDAKVYNLTIVNHNGNSVIHVHSGEVIIDDDNDDDATKDGSLITHSVHSFGLIK